MVNAIMTLENCLASGKSLPTGLRCKTSHSRESYREFTKPFNMTYTTFIHEGHPTAQRACLQISLIVTSGLKFQPMYEFEGHIETAKELS